MEREYIIPLRKKVIKTPQYKRTPKAIKELKKFVAKHMKVEDRDVRKVKLDRYLNEEMWFRGIRKPLPKVKVKVKKMDSGEVLVELAEIPAALKWRIDREKKAEESIKKKVEKKKEEKKEVETPEEKKEEKEKAEAGKETELKEADQQHKEAKHEIKGKKIQKQPLRRMALQK
ncbi:60S ribosomal protein L31 [Candidatus Pacearchaeota archaeon]|nr:60S ribosomal protein L31 [Candidatus Pacearchaeota archaeon]